VMLVKPKISANMLVRNIDAAPNQSRTGCGANQCGLSVISLDREIGNFDRHPRGSGPWQRRRPNSTHRVGCTRQIAAGPVEAGDKPDLHRITSDQEDNWYGRGCRLGGECACGGGRQYDCHLPADQVGCHCGQPIVSPFGPAVLYSKVLVLDVAGVAQALTECRERIRTTSGREAAENTDAQPRRPRS